MNCLVFEERIAEYVDGGLDQAELSLVEQHLRSCPACAEFADRLASDRILLRMPPPEIAEVDFGDMRRQIRRAIVRERRANQLVPALLIAASILLAVGIAAIRLSSGRVPPPSPTAHVKSAVGNDGADPLVRGQGARRPVGIRPDVASLPKGVRRRRADQGVRQATVPQADPALEAALREFVAAEEKPPASPENVSPIEIRIVTSDPNLILILLQENSGASNE